MEKAERIQKQIQKTLIMPFTYPYPRPSVTVDNLIIKHSDVLLIQRYNPPYEGFWALPGGFIEIKETLENAASRELREETGIINVKLKQWRTFDDPDRDPRGRTISVVFTGWLQNSNIKPKAASDASNARWFNINDLPELAFDHSEILKLAKDEFDL